MTEAGPVLAMSLAFAKTPFPVKPGSCGTVVRNAEAKVIDIETGMSLPYNQPGEICIRGPQIMKGEYVAMSTHFPTISVFATPKSSCDGVHRVVRCSHWSR